MWTALQKCYITEGHPQLIGLLPTHSIEQSPSSEANRFSANQEIPRIIWNPKVYYRPSPVQTLRQIIPVHATHPTS